MKDLVDAAGERIKSPYFGYAMIAFLAINWKEIFYLLISNKSVEERISYFEEGTTLNDLVIYPLMFGFLAALLYPWIRLLFQYISRWPVAKYKKSLLSSENEEIIQKTEFEQARNTLFDVREKDLLEKGKRDDELASIQDDETRERVKTEIEKVRAERNESIEAPASSSLTKKNKQELINEKFETLKTLSAIAEQNGDYDTVGQYQHRLLQLQDEALKKLDK